MHVLSSCDIMVAQVVFCQNLCLWLFIGQENVLKSFWWLEDTAERCCPCPFPIFTMIFVTLTTLSQDIKLTHDKTLPLGFTKKMGQLDIAFKIWCSVDIFETKYNKSNILEHFSGLCIIFRNKTRRPIRYLWQNITNLQISTFDASVTPGMCNKGKL